LHLISFISFIILMLFVVDFFHMKNFYTSIMFFTYNDVDVAE